MDSTWVHTAFAVCPVQEVGSLVQGLGHLAPFRKKRVQASSSTLYLTPSNLEPFGTGPLHSGTGLVSLAPSLPRSSPSLVLRRIQDRYWMVR